MPPDTLHASNGRSAHATPAGPPDDQATGLLLHVLTQLTEDLRRLAAGRVEPLLIDAAELARLLDVGLATVERLKSASKLPAHVEVSAGCHRWRLAEVREWAAAGCPPRDVWEARPKGRAGRCV